MRHIVIVLDVLKNIYKCEMPSTITLLPNLWSISGALRWKPASTLSARFWFRFLWSTFSLWLRWRAHSAFSIMCSYELIALMISMKCYQSWVHTHYIHIYFIYINIYTRSWKNRQCSLFRDQLLRIFSFQKSKPYSGLTPCWQKSASPIKTQRMSRYM